MASLTKVRTLPNLRLRPAHGPVTPSSHVRVDALVGHPEHALEQVFAATGRALVSSCEVAQELGWTRHHRSFDELDVFNQGMAVMGAKAHLQLVVARRVARRTESPEGVDLFVGVGYTAPTMPRRPGG